MLEVYRNMQREINQSQLKRPVPNSVAINSRGLKGSSPLQKDYIIEKRDVNLQELGNGDVIEQDAIYQKGMTVGKNITEKLSVELSSGAFHIKK